MKSILIASGDRSWRESLGTFLGLQDDVRVIGEIESIAGIREQLDSLKPDLIIASRRMTDGDLLDLARAMGEERARLIAAVPNLDRPTRLRFRNAGIGGCLDMADGPEGIVSALGSSRGPLFPRP